MEPALLARIAKEIPSARTIKLEDPPTPFKTARILEASAGTTVQIFGGLGGVFLLEELISGATGAMTGFAFPEILARIMKHWNAGEHDAAADVFYRAVPLDALRVPGRHRHGDSQGSAAAPRRAGERRHPRPRGRAGRPDDTGAGSRADVGDDTERHGMDLGLKGKVAMVAGASRGLGFAVAEALAREGATVSMSSSTQASIDDAARRLASGGATVLGTAVDVRNGDHIAAAICSRVRLREGSARIEFTELAICSESRNSTSIPRPSASASTACRYRVDTIAFPAPSA